MYRLGNSIVNQSMSGRQGFGEIMSTQQRPSERDIMAFGGMQEWEVRSSERLRQQPNADMPLLKRAMELTTRKISRVNGYDEELVKLVIKHVHCTC